MQKYIFYKRLSRSPFFTPLSDKERLFLPVIRSSALPAVYVKQYWFLRLDMIRTGAEYGVETSYFIALNERIDLKSR